MPPMEVADLFRQFGHSYGTAHSVPLAERRVVTSHSLQFPNMLQRSIAKASLASLTLPDN